MMSTHIPISQHLGKTVTGEERRSEGDQERKRLSRAFFPTLECGRPCEKGPHGPPHPWSAPAARGPAETPDTTALATAQATNHTRQGVLGPGPAGPSSWEKASPGEKEVLTLPATFC